MTITVIVFTYNRAQVLRVCLEHLEAQDLKDFSVVVVNDGSTDATDSVLEEFQARGSLRLRVLKQPNKGRSAARNLGIANSDTDLSILIGDDILVAPDFVQTHLRFHRERPEREVVGLGLTRWDTVHQRVTPFMEWAEPLQFDYDRLLSGAEPTWRHFYTSNLSFKTELLQTHRFSEQFTRYGLSDVELGYRLQTLGQLRLVFLPEARATHVHPTTFQDAIRRWEDVGFSQHLLVTQWPELRVDIPADWRQTFRRFLAGNRSLLKGLTAFVEKVWGERRHTRLTLELLSVYHCRGFMAFEAAQRNRLRLDPRRSALTDESTSGHPSFAASGRSITEGNSGSGAAD